MKKEEIVIESTPVKKQGVGKILVIILIIVLLLAILIIVAFNIYDYITTDRNGTNVTVPPNTSQNTTPITLLVNNTPTNLTHTTGNNTNPPDDTPSDCTPQCSGKQCGSNGCSGTCSPGCSSGQSCNSTGNCAQLINCTVDSNCSSLSGACGTGKCNQTSKQCYSSYNSTTTLCRNNVSECDAVEMCTGNSVSCPIDVNKSNGALCSSGICTNGKCVGCTPQCSGKQCGSNGCGSTCPPGCSSGQSCNSTGGCEARIIKLTNNISQYNITWYFDKEYEYGTFANGDYWVLGPVIVTRITPDFDGQHNGWMVNMDSEYQGYDLRAGIFNASLIPNLPYTAQPNSSIVKSVSVDYLNIDCRPCLKTAAVLTVLGENPPSNSFRPPFFGIDKKIYSVSQLHLEKLPSVEPPLGYTPDKFNRIEERFKRVQLDVDSYPGENIRPVDNFCYGVYTVSCSYGGSVALGIGDAALRFMLNDSSEEKLPDLIYYTQMGIDLYYMMKNGMDWESNGGHGNGRKLPIIFTAILLDDTEMANAVKLAKYDTFQEDGHLYFSQAADNGNGKVLFGAPTGDYWLNQVTDRGSRTARDPYGFIEPNIPGGSYQGCCNSMMWKGPVIAMQLMPEIVPIWNNSNFVDYVDRWVTFGAWAQPDPCAPVMGRCRGGANDGKICTYANKSFCTGGTCGGGICVGGSDNGKPCGYEEGCNGTDARCEINNKFYQVTYGPNPSSPGTCILDTDSSEGIGRHPYRHGANKDDGGYQSGFANAMWDKYRNNPSLAESSLDTGIFNSIKEFFNWIKNLF